MLTHKSQLRVEKQTKKICKASPSKSLYMIYITSTGYNVKKSQQVVKNNGNHQKKKKTLLAAAFHNYHLNTKDTTTGRLPGSCSQSSL